MNSPEVNRLIAEYRRILLKRALLDLDEELLTARSNALSIDDYQTYLMATEEIDDAVADATSEADVRQYALSTTRQMVSSAANKAGIDR